MSGIQYPNNRLRQLRQDRKISLRALSEKTGVDFATISFCEKGQRNFSANSLKALTDFFGVSSDYMLGKSAEEMYNGFVDSIHNDFVDVEIDANGDACEVISTEVEEPIRSKLNILFRIKDVNDPDHLADIYSNVAYLTAVEDFPPEDDVPASPEAVKLQNEVIALVRQIKNTSSLEVLLDFTRARLATEGEGDKK